MAIRTQRQPTLGRPLRAAPNAHFDAFQRSFAFDRRLLPYEIAVDRAWAKALEPIGIFTSYEVQQTLQALERLENADPPPTKNGWRLSEPTPKTSTIS